MEQAKNRRTFLRRSFAAGAALMGSAALAQCSCAVATINSFADGLFMGQSQQFIETLSEMPAEAAAAQRRVTR